jgi:hypothetical protein
MLVVAGCGSVVPGGVEIDGRKSREQSFSPPYAAVAPGGRPNWISSASLNEDKSVLTVEFVGAKGYLESDACSTDYTGWIGGTADRLEVLVAEVTHVHLGPPVACTAEGYRWTFHFTLPQPYEGTEVIDRADHGGVLLVGTPPDAATLRMLPDGWVLASGEPQCCGGDPPTWVQIYAPAGTAVGDPPEGEGRLVLYQTFGLSPEWTETGAAKWEGRGGHKQAVTVKGILADVWIDPDGEMLLAFDFDGRSYGLIGNLADMTVADFVRYAESVAVP